MSPFPTEPALAVEVPLVLIAHDPLQPRASFDPARIRELANAIQAVGLQQPISVTPHPDPEAAATTPYMIQHGARRYLAFQLLGREAIPTVLHDLPKTPWARFAAQLSDNTDRQDLGLLDRALAYRRLLDMLPEPQQTVASLATLLGKSRPTIANTLHLANSQGLLREALEEGLLAHAETARLFDRLPVPDQKNLLRQARAHGQLISKTRVIASSKRRRKKPDAEVPPPPAPGADDPETDDEVLAAAVILASPESRADQPDRSEVTVDVPLTYPELAHFIRLLGAEPDLDIASCARQLLSLLETVVFD